MRLGPDVRLRMGVPGRALLAGGLVVAPAAAHVLSVSYGHLRLDGADAAYTLRMPLSEVPRGSGADDILGAFGLRSAGRDARRTDLECREDSAQGLYLCEAAYRFEEVPSDVDVRCEYHSVTVPNHVHVLRSGEGEMARQTVFDITYRQATVRFTPPTFVETVASGLGAGARRALASPEVLLFLLALALAGRVRRDLAACAGAFLAGQAAVAVAGSAFGWAPPARFLESAAALTVAYLAAEVLFLPDDRNRWLACAAMGCIHGLFLAAVLGPSQMRAEFFVTGALACEALVLLCLGSMRIRLVGLRAERLVAVLLLTTGLGWFSVRLLT